MTLSVLMCSSANLRRFESPECCSYDDYKICAICSLDPRGEKLHGRGLSLMTRLCSGHTKAARNGKSRFILIANQIQKKVKIKWGLK